MSDSKITRPYARWILLILILVAGTSFRYAYKEGTLVNTPVRGDAQHYVHYAENLLHYATFSKDIVNQPPIPDSYWAPGYPIFLATAIKTSLALGVESYETILNTQWIMGVLAALFTYLVGATFLPAFWPLFPTVLVLLSPHLVSAGQYLLSETLTSFFLIASLLMLIKGVNQANKKLLMAAGITFSVTYLLNPVTIFVAPLGILVIHLKKKTRQGNAPDQHRRFLLWAVYPLLLVVSLWALRAYMSVPEESPTSSTRLLTNLVQGMHHDFHRIWRANHNNPENPATLDLATVGQSYSVFLQLLLEKISSDPLGMANWYLLQKPLLLWDWDIRVGMGDIFTFPVFYSLYHTSHLALASHVVMKSMHLWLFGCAVLSFLYILRDNSRESWIPTLLYSSLLYISAVYCVTQAEPRYSIPMRPEMYLLATYFIYRTYTLYRDTKTKQATEGKSESIQHKTAPAGEEPG